MVRINRVDHKNKLFLKFRKIIFLSFAYLGHFSMTNTELATKGGSVQKVIKVNMHWGIWIVEIIFVTF